MAPFLVLDGVDGCGKSTQAERLAGYLRVAGGGEVLHLREPGSTALGEALRELLLSRAHRPTPAVEALLFAAARRQMLDELVAPALARGAAVVCERFHASTFAYQGVAGGLGEEEVLALLSTWAGRPAPDLTLVLDLDARRAAGRRGAAADRIEDLGLEFQERVAEGYRRYARRVERVALIDGSGEPDDVFARVLAEVRRVL